MSEKIVVVALGHRALGTTLPEQKVATKAAAKAIADLVEEGAKVVISHSNGPQIGMIHTAMNEFGKTHPDYTFAPMSVCSAMSQGYIGYDIQNALRAELLRRGIYKPVNLSAAEFTNLLLPFLPRLLLIHMTTLLQIRRKLSDVFSLRKKLKQRKKKETLSPDLLMADTDES